MNTTTDSTSGAPRRRKSRKGLIFAIVVILAGGGWYGWHKYKLNANKEGEYITAPVTTGSIEDLVTSTGKLQPRDYVDVGAQVSGQIEAILVEVGDEVKKGQDLVKIDAESAQARMEQSEASLATAKNNLETQKENLKKTERDYLRQKNLLEQDATTKQQVLDAETAYENAKRQLKSSELSIANTEAGMRIEKRNLAFTTIQAPIDGTVMSIQVKLGQTVNASQNVPNVLRIANLDTMTVQAEVSEADVSKLYDGNPVYFTTLSNPTRRWYGQLKRIEPTPKEQNSVVLYNALFDVQNEGTTLKPSMTAQVFFVSAEARDVLLVPMAALTQGQQIARELAQKEREKNGGKPAAPGAPGAGGPGGPAAAGAAPGAAPGNVAATAAPVAAGSAPATATAASGGNAAAGTQRGNRPEGGNAQGNRPAGQGMNGGQGMRAGQPGGGFGGQRQGQGQGQGANGQAGGNGQRAGGFNMQNLSPEQIAEFRRMREQGGGFGGGPRPGGGNFGGFNGQRPGGNLSGATAGGGPRQPQTRRGTVMVVKADGTLEPRQVVVGVTDRVHGQVISGLKEGEEVVVAKRETEAAAAARPNNNNQNFNPGNRGNQGGFPGGGGNFRPF